MSEKQNAFVIMPFDSEFTAIFVDLIKPALEEAGYDVRRADSFFDQENILRDIVRGISNANLVIAELTVPNPNVYYELGLCHGLKIPTILISQSMEMIPFDLRTYRIRIYSTQFDKVGEFKQSLTDIGNKHKNNEIKFGSPVIDFLEVGNENYLPNVIPATLQSTQTEDQLKESATEESGFLDFMVGAQDSSVKIEELMNTIAESTQDIGTKMSSYTTRIESISSNPGPGTAAKAQKIAIFIAKEIDKYSKILEDLLPELEDTVENMDENYTGYIKWFTQVSKNNKQEIIEWRNQIDDLREAAVTGLTGMSTFRDSIDDMTNMSINREINKSSRHLSFVLEKVIIAIEIIEAFCTKSLLLMDERIEQAEG